MLKKIARWVAPLLLAAVLVGGTEYVSAIQSTADQLLNICTNNAGSYTCQNNWGGITAQGNPINFYPYNSGTITNNKWAVNWVGYVNGSNCTNNCWPFTSGSGMNSRYNGRPVYIMEWGPSPSWCEDQGNYGPESEAGALVLGQCTYDQFDWFVYSAANYLVGVYATNAQFAWDGNGNHIPIFAGNSGTLANGTPVYMNNIWYNTWALLPAS